MSTEQEPYGKMAEPVTFKFGTPDYLNTEDLCIKSNKLPENTITSITNKTDKTPILMLCDNGDIFVKGKLIENDKEVVDAMREFLLSIKS